MKSFKDFIKTTDSDVSRQYMQLYQKSKEGSLNPFDAAKLKIMRVKITDPMIKHRQKMDDKAGVNPERGELVPTRSGSKGGDGGSGNGNGSN
jgi:hypothetical protein